jgi:hypothetical protein
MLVCPPATPVLVGRSRAGGAARRMPAVLARAIGCAALALPSCRSGHDAPAPPPSATPLADPLLLPDTHPRAMGELGHAHDYSMSVESVRDCPMDAPFAPKRGFVKVGVEVVIEGTTALEVPVNPFYATVTDRAGDTYTSTLAGCEPGLPSVRVTAGKQSRGFATFEIPKAARKLELRYAPIVIGPGTEELRFTLTR